jgi:hypothetical protein
MTRIGAPMMKGEVVQGNWLKKRALLALAIAPAVLISESYSLILLGRLAGFRSLVWSYLLFNVEFDH